MHMSNSIKTLRLVANIMQVALRTNDMSTRDNRLFIIDQENTLLYNIVVDESCAKYVILIIMHNLDE